MDAKSLTDLMSTLGFPVVCVIALAYFAFWMVNRVIEENAKNKLNMDYPNKNQIRYIDFNN